MNNENEIERMEQLIDTATRAATKRFTDETSRWVKEHHSYDSRRDVEAAHSKSIYREVAESLVNAGIGDKEQAVKEFAEKLKGLCDEKRKLFDKLYDNCAAGQAQLACSFIERRNEWIEMKQKIDNLITELYGADDE